MNPALILHARTVLPVHSEPITDGAVAVENGLIAACGPYPSIRKQFPSADELDLTDCVLLPGLVNAHTHLELSPLKGQVPYRGDFVDWVRRLIAARISLLGQESDIISSACKQSLHAGVTTVADISYHHRTWPQLAQQRVRKTCFAEVLGQTRDLAAAEKYLQQCITDTPIDDALLQLGLSPHAPYSACAEVYRLAARLAAQHRLPLTTHLAETPIETELLTKGTGPWVDYLRQIGKWDASFACPYQKPVEYFLSLDLADQPFLLAHVNYISDEELDALARTSHSVAYCPRSHRFFGHPEHPLARMLQRRINVCLGTDSLASNSSLSILDEMRFLHRYCPYLPGETLLRMGTINGAIGLGWQDRIGDITAGKEADLIALPISDNRLDPLTDVLESAAQPKLTMLAGQIIYQKH